MLVLGRKEREIIVIGDDIRLTIVSIKAGMVRVGIEAPKEIPVLRGELLEQYRKEHPTGGDR